MHVLLIGTPFEVAHMIVELVAVDMINARQTVRVRCECLDDQPMHLATIRFFALKIFFALYFCRTLVITYTNNCITFLSRS